MDKAEPPRMGMITFFMEERETGPDDHGWKRDVRGICWFVILSFPFVPVGGVSS
jgi:hypothetical protein